MGKEQKELSGTSYCCQCNLTSCIESLPAHYASKVFNLYDNRPCKTHVVVQLGRQNWLLPLLQCALSAKTIAVYIAGFVDNQWKRVFHAGLMDAGFVGHAQSGTYLCLAHP